MAINKTLLFLSAVILSIFCYSTTAQETLKRPTIVLIIDDMGNNLALGEQALNLPGAINYSFLPHIGNTKVLAHSAHTKGKEVLLHIPMSNLSSKPLGPGGLSPRMNRQQFLTTLRGDLAAIPHVRGLNNHMGSLLTQLREPMTWLAKELKQQNLYFVDSRTSPLSVAESTAKNYYIPTLRRDIFLDNNRDSKAIALQFEKLLDLAKTRGYAVAIGHPHPETIAFLARTIPTLSARGIDMSFASKILAAQTER